jgi:hypothetical protein
MHPTSPVQVYAGSVYIEVITICSSSHVYDGGIGVGIGIGVFYSCWPYTSGKAASAIEIADRSFMTATLETTSSHL